MSTFFEKKIENQTIKYRYAIGKSLQEGREIHPYYEILYYIDGDAVFISENYAQKLKPKSLVLIPKEHFHKFRINDQNNYRRLVINFPEIPRETEVFAELMSKIRIIENPGKHIVHILNRICEVMSEIKNEELSTEFVHGAFTMLLPEICFDDVGMYKEPQKRGKGDFISQCTKYIAENISSDITTETLALAMNVSQSTVFNAFKRGLGVSPHKYIVEKRLIYARNLIVENGANPTKIFYDCGYNDYPSFYKAYVKMYGHPPSTDKK